MAKKKRKYRKLERSLPVMRANAGGIDIGATEIFVAVPADRDTESVRSFSTFTQDLHALADWLQQCRVDTVAMESTGVYWIPLFQILEARGIEVHLVNAQHVHHVPGRKSDVLDCQWLQYLHSVGLLRASFRPEHAVCEIRSLMRHRENLVHMHTGHLNEVFAMPHQGANFAYGVFGAKRGPQQAHRMQILKPLTIEHVRLAPGNVMHMLSIDQMNFNTPRFQNLKQWYPVHSGGFHSHRVHTTLLQPVRQSMKILGKRRKRSHRFRIAIGWYGDKNLRRSDVDTTGIRSHHRQAPLQFAILPFLLGHGSSPLIRFGNEPGVQEMKSLKRDHHNTNRGCASPMLLRTGLGSNSSTGSPKQAPLGTRPTLTAAVSNFLGHIRDSIGPDPSNGKFLTVIVWPQDSWDTPLRGGEYLSQQPVQLPQFHGRVRSSSHCLLGNKPVAAENDIVLLDDFVNACGGYGDETIFQALNPGFLPQIPERKFQVLGRASQQTFHLNDADSAPVRVTPA